MATFRGADCHPERVVPQVGVGSSNEKDSPPQEETSLCVLPGHQQDLLLGLPQEGEGAEEGQDVGWCPGNCQEVGRDMQVLYKH